ncbi:MAG: precorrin-6A synthase (deacetylating) [Silicimonas sp.]|nr:precorrin-6A synthase (deacetylating) [Silicimonas sp.]
MKELTLIGIGTGNPDHLTRAGEAAIREAELILIPRKGSEKSDLADLRRTICASVLGPEADDRVLAFDLPVRDASGDYRQGVDSWHDAIALAWSKALETRAASRVALLVWGDPSLYDSSLRIAGRLSPMPKIAVVPGITALQALTAAHAIPLNAINALVVITTGRRLRDDGWPEAASTVAVMLDGECSFTHLDPKGLDIWWGAFLGMENQILLKGPLASMTDQIVRTRQDARARHGWIMDTYLLKRRD